MSTKSSHESFAGATRTSKEIFWYEEVTSTMDKARDIIHLDNLASEGELFAVVAERQTNARGTRGRTWVSGANNLLITISIPLNRISIPWTLIPLRYAVFA